MIRRALKTHLDQDPYFQWRGDSVTRIENLSDIVFALALGMLVSSSSPPLNGFAGWLMVLIWPLSWVVYRSFPMPAPDLATGRSPTDTAESAS